MILAMLKQLLFPGLWKFQFLKASLTSLLKATQKSVFVTPDKAPWKIQTLMANALS
jgi:hypothetical protein